MARISSPGHPDCSIDCPGSGYAVFVDPYGPCMAGCDQDQFGTVIRDLFRNQHEIGNVSGRAVGVTGGVLSRMALSIRDLAEDDSADDRAWLENLSITRDDSRFSAEWRNTSLSGVLKALAEATGKPRLRAA